MPMQWPTYEKQPSNESNAVGNYIDFQVAKQLAQSAANLRHLQAARAEEAKRTRQESIAAQRVFDTDFIREA